ncbi:tRNA (adenosine(37)-N6)-threonylcarbamoyltransferase complex dimerization subunit type 1 TsaB [Desulfovibrio sp. OttesenSCG-928-C14]|nr:tRNA (adenosine(37)-N6)-threonylcarbamoyltransferase complex dimerization subunit type 1 TsaB [Desulfovibrio sp. OttesenSCG-928-C14]
MEQARGSLTLVLNAAEGRLQLVLGRDGAAGPELLCAQEYAALSQGAETLAPALQSALGTLGLSPADLARVAVVRGPGSFTGLRLVCVSAAALARALGIPQAPLDYPPLLAAAAVPALSAQRFSATGAQSPSETDTQRLAETKADSSFGINSTHPLAADAARPSGANSARPDQERLPDAQTGNLSESGMVWVFTHARRDLVYAQGFRAAPDFGGYAGLGLLPATGLEVKDLEGAAMLVRGSVLLGISSASLFNRVFVLGSGLTRNRSFFERAFAASLAESAGPASPGLLPALFDHPRPDVLLRAACGLAYGPEDVAPLYVRPSDAEDELEHIAAKLGLEPGYARSRLQELLAEEPSPE